MKKQDIDDPAVIATLIFLQTLTSVDDLDIDMNKVHQGLVTDPDNLTLRILRIVGGIDDDTVPARTLNAEVVALGLPYQEDVEEIQKAITTVKSTTKDTKVQGAREHAQAEEFLTDIFTQILHANNPMRQLVPPKTKSPVAISGWHMTFSALVLLGSFIASMGILLTEKFDAAASGLLIVMITWLGWMVIAGSRIGGRLFPTTIIIQGLSLAFFISIFIRSDSTMGYYLCQLVGRGYNFKCIEAVHSNGIFFLGLIIILVLGIISLNRMGRAFTRMTVV